MKKSHQKVFRIGLVATLFAALITTAAQGADVVSTTLKAPKEIAGVPPLPFTGLKSATFTTPTDAKGSISIEPLTGYVGEDMTISGKGFPANTPVQLVWGTTENTSWAAEVTPATVNYLGATYTTAPFYVDIATITTNAQGEIIYKTKVPADFGGTHDVFGVINGAAAGKGGMQIGRTMKITPDKGPIGTQFTLTYTGLGPKVYGSGGAVLYDNKYAGEINARWTRGQGHAILTASGPVGKHYVTANPAMGISYLNIIQSPDPFGNPGNAVFTVTKDPGYFKPTITYPSVMTPTIDQKTTVALATNTVDPNSKAVATLSVDRGVVGSKTTLKVSGLSTTGVHNIVWSTVVGNRWNCTTGTCWVYSPIALGTSDVTAGSIEKEVTIPDHLGGWHVIQVMSGDKIEAQIPYYVKQSIVEFKDKNGKVISQGTATFVNSTAPDVVAKGQSGVGQTKFKDGEEFTISVKGVGWTQLDNTLSVTYDNAHVGYACGFNSNGYVVVRLRATGAPGTHIINLRPLLYTIQPSMPNQHFSMVPFLSWDTDYPGLALGYQIPMYTFAITITK